MAVEFYHLEAMGRRNRPEMPQAIAKLDSARAAGLDVQANMYPYVAGGTALGSCLPPWAAADGKLLDDLRDPAVRARMRAEELSDRTPRLKFGTDAGGADPDGARGLVHPRAYGTFPRILGRYVREERVIPLEDAVRTMTSAIATRLSIADRGALRAGKYAEVVRDGRHTGAKPGRVVRGPGWRGGV